MIFQCRLCSERYLDLGGDDQVVDGICEPCSRKRLGPILYAKAVERAAQQERISRPKPGRPITKKCLTLK